MGSLAPLVLASLLAAPHGDAPGPGAAGARFVAVGQGSAMVLVGPAGHVVAVDSGPSGGAEVLVAALDQMGIHRVDLWVHTHYDADHIGGLARVLRGRDDRLGSGDDITLALAWDRGDRGRPDHDAMRSYLGAVASVRQAPAPGDRFAREGLEVRVLDGPTQQVSTENQRGLALCVELAGRRFFVPGDRPARDLLAAARSCGAVDVLWVSHHGARDGTDASLVQALDPAAAVISSGRENGHCHPHGQVLALLADRPTYILDGAGVSPGGTCAPLAPHLGPAHRFVVGDLWIGVVP